MAIGTKWRVEFETTEGMGNSFLEGAISDMIGTDENDKLITKNIKVTCLKEFTEREYKEHDKEIRKMHEILFN